MTSFIWGLFRTWSGPLGWPPSLDDWPLDMYSRSARFIFPTALYIYRREDGSISSTTHWFEYLFILKKNQLLVVKCYFPGYIRVGTRQCVDHRTPDPQGLDLMRESLSCPIIIWFLYIVFLIPSFNKYIFLPSPFAPFGLGMVASPERATTWRWGKTIRRGWQLNTERERRE